jgi:hypothetical protein
MEHWRLIYSATRTNQQLRLARAARVQAVSAVKTKEAQDRRQGDKEGAARWASS